MDNLHLSKKMKEDFIEESLVLLYKNQLLFSDFKNTESKQSLDKLLRIFHQIQKTSKAVELVEINEMSNLLKDLISQTRKGEILVSAQVKECIFESKNNFISMLEHLKDETGPKFRNDDFLKKLKVVLAVEDGHKKIDGSRSGVKKADSQKNLAGSDLHEKEIVSINADIEGLVTLQQKCPREVSDLIKRLRKKIIEMDVLTTLSGIVVEIRGALYLLPLESVIGFSTLHSSESSKATIRYEADLIDVVELFNSDKNHEGPYKFAVIIEHSGKKVAIKVHDLKFQQKVILNDMSTKTKISKGYAILADGNSCTVLNVQHLVKAISSKDILKNGKAA